MAFNNAEDDRHPQPCSPSGLLRAEEGLEDPAPCRFIHPHAGIARPDLDIHACFGQGEPVLHRPVCRYARRDAQRPPAGHRIAGVDAYIQEHLVDLCGVGEHGREPFGQVRGDRDALRKCLVKKFEELPYDVVHANRFPAPFVLPREREELADHARSPFRGPCDGLDRGRVSCRVVCRPLHERDVAEDDRKEIVEVVRDAAGERSDALHLLGLEDLRLERLPFGDVLVHPVHSDMLPFDQYGIACDVDVDDRPVLPPACALFRDGFPLLARGAQRARLLPEGGGDDDVVDVPSADLFVGVSEHHLERLVDHHDVVVGVHERDSGKGVLEEPLKIGCLGDKRHLGPFPVDRPSDL